MRNQFTKPQSFYSKLLNISSHLFASTLAVSFTVVGFLPAIATAKPETPSPAPTSDPTSMPNGVYLYGQSQKPDQIGRGYFVFEVNQGKVVGALYMPRSSFDCASGEFGKEELALTVVNSYDRQTNPFQIALQKNYNVAKNGNPVEASQVNLEGFYKLDKVTANDKRMLELCKADLQKQGSSQPVQ